MTPHPGRKSHVSGQADRRDGRQCCGGDGLSATCESRSFKSLLGVASQLLVYLPSRGSMNFGGPERPCSSPGRDRSADYQECQVGP